MRQACANSTSHAKIHQHSIQNFSVDFASLRRNGPKFLQMEEERKERERKGEVHRHFQTNDYCDGFDGFIYREARYKHENTIVIEKGHGSNIYIDTV